MLPNGPYVKLPGLWSEANFKNLDGFFPWKFTKQTWTQANHLVNSCQISLDPTANLAMKNPIVSREDDGSNL